jgi:hypothetical protein
VFELCRLDTDQQQFPFPSGATADEPLRSITRTTN